MRRATMKYAKLFHVTSGSKMVSNSLPMCSLDIGVPRKQRGKPHGYKVKIQGTGTSYCLDTDSGR